LAGIDEEFFLGFDCSCFMLLELTQAIRFNAAVTSKLAGYHPKALSGPLIGWVLEKHYPHQPSAS
jgi:hypothetical protein